MGSISLRTQLGIATTALLVAVLGPFEAWGDDNHADCQSSSSVHSAVTAYTEIQTRGHIASSLPFLYDHCHGGSTTITSPQHEWQTDPQLQTDGLLDGEGIADFGTLRARVHIEGPSALEGHAFATLNDLWTVTNPALTGTQGTMRLAFDLHGTASVLDSNGDPVSGDSFAQVGLGAFLDQTGQNPGNNVLAYSQALSSGQVIGILSTAPGSPVVSSSFSFTYGVPFQVGVGLTVHAFTDNAFIYATTVPAYFESYGGGTVDEVTLEFLSTAELVAIVIPADPFAHVAGSSGEDHTNKVTTALAVSPVTPDEVAYTATGTLSNDPDLLLEEGDVLDLEGATLVISAVASRNDAPDSTTSDSGLESGGWFYTTSYSFTNRPNGAPDFSISGRGRLHAQNWFPPEVVVDSFGFDVGPETIMNGDLLELPEAFIYFDDQSQFSGTGTPILPDFAPEDIADFYGGHLAADGEASYDYKFNIASFTVVEAQSVPASSRWGGMTLFGLLLASGIAMAVRARGRLLPAGLGIPFL